MKYTILALTAACVLFTNCKNSTEKDPNQLVDDAVILSMNDSIGNIVKNFIVTKDSASMLQALAINDRILNLDKTEEGQHFGTLSKIQLLTLLGKKQEVFALQSKVIDADPNSVDRLVYNGLKSHTNKTDSASIYFSQAIQQCNKAIALKPDETKAIIDLVTIYFYMGEKEKAKSEVDRLLTADSTNKSLIDMRDNFEALYESSAKLME